MAGETQVTVCGNLVADPELRFLPNGAPVANFTIASTPRTFNKQSNDWVDGEPLFLRASVWREAAENVAATLKRGMRVIAQGRLKSRSYETKEGEKRTSMELEVEEIGPSLRFASANINRNQRGQQGNGGYTAPPTQNGYAQRAAAPQGTPQGNPAPQGNQPPQVDPWGAQQGGNNYSWGGGADGEPPF